MKKLLIGFILIISTSSFGSESISCICNVNLGFPGGPESEKT